MGIESRTAHPAHPREGDQTWQGLRSTARPYAAAGSATTSCAHAPCFPAMAAWTGGSRRPDSSTSWRPTTTGTKSRYTKRTSRTLSTGSPTWLMKSRRRYHSVRDLPAADFLGAGVSCINHSQANTIKAYEQGLTLFDMPDPDFDARVTRSEKDRATANCVLHYAARHHPRLILVECTTQLVSWGKAIPGRPKVGDGTTFRWWLKQFTNLRPAYKYKILYLNSMFFGVGQSRDRLYIVFWDERLPTPDLEHRPPSWCGRCEQIVEAVWTWRTGIPATGKVCYGQQYDYRCPRCRAEVYPPMTPSLDALDLTNLGTRIGDRETPYAAATMARAERCRQRFGEFPLVVIPAAAVNGTAGHPWQRMAGQAGEHEAGIAMTGAVFPRTGTTATARTSQDRWTR